MVSSVGSEPRINPARARILSSRSIDLQSAVNTGFRITSQYVRSRSYIPTSSVSSYSNPQLNPPMNSHANHASLQTRTRVKRRLYSVPLSMVKKSGSARAQPFRPHTSEHGLNIYPSLLTNECTLGFYESVGLGYWYQSSSA